MALTFSRAAETRRMVAEERSDLVTLLETLSADEWETPSLCEGWRIRDVVAHLCYDSMPMNRYLMAFVRNGFSGHRLNRDLIDASGGLDPSELINALRSSVGRGMNAGLAPTIVLADTLVHQQDIRRPLQRPRTIPADRLLAVLDHPDPFASSRHRTRGLRFVATDVTWSRGEGLEVRGPGEAICLATMGRPIALDELNGNGLSVLRERFVTK